MKYRTDIDGLRAFSILSVIIYHSFFYFNDQQLLAGGFLGVDIFFVISGFLITQLIKKEYDCSGGFSFARFYVRRARRLLPAIFTVIIITLFFSYQHFDTLKFSETAKSALSSILFASNFFFALSGMEYGAESNLLIPLFHTWSLSVEEQFYLFYPICLILAIRINLKMAAAFVISIFFISFFAAIITENISANLNFLSSLSRFWEMAFGGILVLFYDRFRINKKFAEILSVFGLVLIIFSFVNLKNGPFHPGPATLIPVIGVGLILYFCNNQSIVGKFLSIKPFQLVGKWSYSLYIWHFPIFAFARLHLGELQIFEKIECIALSFLVAAASYYIIEEPFRRTKRFQPIIILGVILSLGTLIILTSAYIIFSKGMPSRFPDIFANWQPGDRKPWTIVVDPETGKVCHNGILPCYWQSNGPTALKVAIIGDSDAGAHAKVIVPNLAQRGYNVMLRTRGWCPVADLGHFMYRDKQTNTLKVRGCDSVYQSKRFAEVENFSPDIILHYGRIDSVMHLKSITRIDGSANGTGSDLVAEGIRRLRQIAPVVYVQSLPFVPSSLPEPRQYLLKLLDGVKYKYKMDSKITSNPMLFEPPLYQTKNWIHAKRILTRNEFLSSWDLNCNTNMDVVECRPFDKDGLYYFDRGHPTDLFIEKLTKKVLERVDEILKN